MSYDQISPFKSQGHRLLLPLFPVYVQVHGRNLNLVHEGDGVNPNRREMKASKNVWLLELCLVAQQNPPGFGLRFPLYSG